MRMELWQLITTSRSVVPISECNEHAVSDLVVTWSTMKEKMHQQVRRRRRRRRRQRISYRYSTYSS